MKDLEVKFQQAVPAERGFRTAAAALVRDLKSASHMFNANTLGYSREMISDTQKHEAQTVGQLLAFMRKYRLMFATADMGIGGVDAYSQLYGLMKARRRSLELDERPCCSLVRRMDAFIQWPRVTHRLGSRQGARKTGATVEARS